MLIHQDGYEKKWPHNFLMQTNVYMKKFILVGGMGFIINTYIYKHKYTSAKLWKLYI